MKFIATVTAAAVAVTTPISVCSAQSYEECLSRCDQEYYQQYDRCVQYGASIEGEYCFLGAGQEWDACRQGCQISGTALSKADTALHRFRPVQIRHAKTETSLHRG